MSETAEENVCAVCRKKAVQKCSGCKSVFYCNRDHQKCHWKEHSKQCKSFKLAEGPLLGRHYIASRKIDIGEVILTEQEPLVKGPIYTSVPVCLNCYVGLDDHSAVPCKKCGWPLCRNCKHHGPECQFTTRYKNTKVSITEFGYPHPTYRCISVIKALSLKDVNSEAYAILLNLQSHYDIMKKQLDFTFEETLDIARFIKRFFNVDAISEEEIAKIAGILQINGHEVPTTDIPHMAVYHQASFFEHNCKANCSKSFTDNGGLVIRAFVPIAKGEHLSICYTDPLWGITNRRHHLAQTKFFECICERCKDPTEFGTMFNAILCNKENCSGCMLPSTFLYKGDVPPYYICQKCQSTMSWNKVEQMLEKIGIELSQMTKNDINACKVFINQYKNVLHENHFYNTDVNLALAQLIGQQGSGLLVTDDTLLNEKILLCQKLNTLLKILVPAENRIRGLLLFELHAAIAEFGRRQGKEKLSSILMESRKLLLEAYQLLRHEPIVLPEGKLAINARKKIVEMDMVLKTLHQNVAPW